MVQEEGNISFIKGWGCHVNLKLPIDDFKTPLQRKLLTAFRNNLARNINLMGEETVCRSQKHERKERSIEEISEIPSTSQLNV